MYGGQQNLGYSQLNPVVANVYAISLQQIQIHQARELKY